MPRIGYAVLLMLLLTACKDDRLEVDISGIQTKPMECQRLDQDLFKANPDNVKEVCKGILSTYGTFFEHYAMNLLKVNGTADSLYNEKLLSFVQDKDITGAQKQVQKIYTAEEMKKISDELNDCVKRYKYHFPKRKVPAKFVSCLSGWNYAFAYTDSTLVSSLDMYLGDTCIYYQMLQLPNFRTRYMNKHYLLPDLLRGWMITEFDNTEPTNTLVYHTIFYGRIYYCVNALLPDIADTTLMFYTGAQMKYCKEFEKNLWGYFAEKNRLYETNMKTIQELTSDGPFTSAISKECPPRIAMWVGLQIVRSYMKNNEKVTLEELMAEKDAQKILARSKYRP